MAGSDGSLIFDTDLDTEGFKRGSSKLHNAINKLVSSVGKIGNIDPVSKDFRAKIEQTKATIEDLRAKLVEMGEKTISSKGYEETNAAIVKAEKNLTRLVHRQKELYRNGVSRDSAQWERLSVQIQDAAGKMEKLAEQKKRMEADGSAYTHGFQTEEYAALKEQLHEAEAALLQYEAAQKKVSKSSWVASAVGGLKSALKSVGSAAVSTTKKLLLLPLSAVSTGFKKAASGIKEYIKNIGKSHSGTRGLLKGLTSLKTMLFSRVKRMFISNIFNAMKEAMNALQQYDKSFGTAMNNMKNAAKGLSANLAISFGGLISAIEPVLTKIISAISTAISYINALFAMLSGKSTMTVAKKQMDGYAKSTGGAAGAAKELNKQLMGFDELNRLSDNSDSGGGGGGGANPADLFEEVPIDSLLPDSVKDYFERIKAAFEAGDWESIGSIIAEGLNSGMGAVDRWITGTLQPMAVLWSERTALLLNGLIKGVNWNLMGKTIADGLNTVFKSVDTFLTTFDFAATGQAVANLVIGFFSNIDWESIAHGLGEGIQGAFDFLSGFIQTVDWSALPGNILDTLLRIIKAVDWTGIAKSFAGYLGSAIGAELAIGAKITETIGKGIAGLVDWVTKLASEDGQAIVDGLLNGISEKIKDIGTWIKTNIFEPFMTGFKNAFGIHSPSTVMQEQGNFIIDGLLNGIKNTWSKITSFFSNAVQTVITEFRNTPWADIGINICNGITEGLSNGWNWLVQTVQNIASGLLNTAKSILGIHSPSRVFRDQIGENIGLGLAEGIENSEKDVNRSVAALAKSTVDGFGSQEISFNVAGTEMVSGLDRVADKLSSIANTFQAITAMLNTVGSLVVPEIATGTIAPYKTRTSSASNDDDLRVNTGRTDPEKIDNIINLLSEVIRAIKEIDPAVVIDEDMIGMAATRYQNRRKLSLGV